jgi:5'-phosphate synthase pdxT subunit
MMSSPSSPDLPRPGGRGSETAGHDRRRVGLLALQGDYEAHASAFADLGVRTRYVTRPGHLDEVDSLLLPGGESTTIAKLIEAYALAPALAEFRRSGRPLFGTCAGLILLARDIVGHPAQPRLGFLDLSVDRNAYGRQVESFETQLEVPALGREPVPAVFIRAPRIARTGPQVEILARLDGEAVLVRQGSILGATFHPELTADRRVHRLFLEMGQARAEADAA